MLRRWRRWLAERFLPAYCRHALLEENERLQNRLAALEARLARREAYIRGMERALRRPAGREEK